MIVAGVPLVERTPVELRGNARCIAFDKRYCEAMGLIKLDVLGLATLDLLDSAKRYIKESTGKTSISMLSHWTIVRFWMGSLQGTRRAYSSWSPVPCASCLKIWAVASSQ